MCPVQEAKDDEAGGSLVSLCSEMCGQISIRINPAWLPKGGPGLLCTSEPPGRDVPQGTRDASEDSVQIRGTETRLHSRSQAGRACRHGEATG